MAESQSRFSIIEELTNKKAQAEDMINQHLKDTEDEKLNLGRWEADIEREKGRKHESLELAEAQRTRAIKTLRERLVELERGIKAIERISATEAK